MEDRLPPANSDADGVSGLTLCVSVCVCLCVCERHLMTQLKHFRSVTNSVLIWLLGVGYHQMFHIFDFLRSPFF